jgi:Zn-dependent protease
MTEFILLIVIVLISITVHEYSHAKAADMLGDPTPRLAGRLTLNPIAHIDPIGFLMFIVIKIGWAKPVPINPYNFKDPKKDVIIVGAAGPISNFLMAWVVAILAKTLPISGWAWYSITQSFVFINIALAVFNLLPIPPLDGSRIFTQYLPYEWQENLERYGFVILLIVLLFPPIQYLFVSLINAIYGLIS